MKKKTTVADIISTVTELSGAPLNPDEGVQLGRSDRTVQRALVCWMATPDALLAAERSKAQLVVAHESLFYPYNSKVKAGETQPWEAWRTNRQRREIIERADMTLLRIHGSADKISIFDVNAAVLGLTNPVPCNEGRKVFEIEPTTLRALVKKVKSAVGMDHVRVSCSEADLRKKVCRIGLPWGGLGLFVNVKYQEWALENGCDVLIAGESDSYGFRFSAECGVPMIETSHEVSEVPGLKKFTALLAERRPGVTFRFFEQGNPWRWM